MKFGIAVLIFTQGLLFGRELSSEDSTALTSNEIRLYSDVTIDSSQVSVNTIRILGGSLNVYGTVEGQITVVGGDIHIFPSAIINGTIISIGGEVHRDPSAQITGKIIEAGMDQGFIYRETSSDSTRSIKDDQEKSDFFQRKDVWYHTEPGIIAYNRNEGLRFTPLYWNWDRGNQSRIRLSFSFGYRFGSKEFIGRTTVEAVLFNKQHVTLFTSGFKTSLTDDEWRLPESENTWAGLLGRQDFYDRWDETGLEAGFSLNFKRLKLKTRYVKADRSPIQVTNEMWSLTNSNRPLRSNLITENRDMESIISAAAFRTTGYSPVSTGFAVLTEVEWLLKSNGLSDPNFRLFSMILGGWEMSEGIIFRGRGILGRSSEAVPAYRMFGVGGLGSVSGHRYKIQSGSTMEQVNLELVFTEEFTQKGFLFKIFYDGGKAYSPSTQPAEMLQGAGFGFGTSKKDGLGIGFNVARALDGKNPVESTVRFNYNF